MFVRRLLALGASLALHLLAAAIIQRFEAAAFGQPFPGAAGGHPTVVFVQPADGKSSAPGEPAGGTAAHATHDDLGIHVEEGASKVSMPGFTFDFGKVADRATSLFPFLTRTLSIDQVTVTPRRAGSRGLGNPFAQPRIELVNPPLVLRDAALQSLLDKSWSRRDRWKAFQPVAALANAYNADQGRLPALLRGYGKQNGLQPYVDTTIRDPRLWIQLGLAADHADFIDFIGRYASRYPSTKATTELLFLLDKLVEASLDALVTLVDIDPKDDLRWSRSSGGGAYELILAIQRYYAAQLERRALTSRDALRTHYDDIRLTILNGILRTTPSGYRANDARFLIGAIYWKRGRAADAVRSWSAITRNPEDGYLTAYSEILAAIGDPTSQAGSNVNARRINRILDGERGRWISLSFDRLRQFGYRFDTY
jgi:hypothetical protein